MAAPEFALFKYLHGGPPLVSPARRRFTYASAAAALLATVLAFPAGALLWLVPLLARFTAGRYLQLGPRYLLCGSTIVYYGNVRRMALSRSRCSCAWARSNQSTIRSGLRFQLRPGKAHR